MYPKPSFAPEKLKKQKIIPDFGQILEIFEKLTSDILPTVFTLLLFVVCANIYHSEKRKTNHQVTLENHVYFFNLTLILLLPDISLYSFVRYFVVKFCFFNLFSKYCACKDFVVISGMRGGTGKYLMLKTDFIDIIAH